MADKQEEYFENLFGQIKKMEEKLSEMDSLVQKIDALDAKYEKYRPKTSQEKLELRSLDSGPYNQKLSERRAAAVKSYLLSQSLPADRIYTQGKGESEPIASNNSIKGRSENRRVDIEVVSTRQQVGNTN
jgi:hypothetical protein